MLETEQSNWTFNTSCLCTVYVDRTCVRAFVEHFAKLTVFFMKTYYRCLVYFSNFVIVSINHRTSCRPILANHTSTNRTPQSSDFVNYLYDYRPNWTPLGPSCPNLLEGGRFYYLIYCY